MWSYIHIYPSFSFSFHMIIIMFLRGLMVKSACFCATTGSEGVGSNPTPEHNFVRAHGTLNGGGLYPVYYVGATERPWTSLNEKGMC